MLKARTKGAAHSAAFGAAAGAQANHLHLEAYAPQVTSTQKTHTDQTSPTCKIWQRAAVLACAGLITLAGTFGLGTAGLLGSFQPADAHAVETRADGSLQVTSSSRAVIAAGETFEYNLEAVNTDDQPITYMVSASSYYVNSADYSSASFNIDNTYTQLHRWITFQDQNGNWAEEVTRTVPSGGEDILTYRITVPEDIPAGGQYAVIFFEMTGSEPEGMEGSGVTTVIKPGCIVYASTQGGETRAEAHINYMDTTSFIVDGNFKTTASVTNTGNTDIPVTYTLTMKTVFGRTVYEVTPANSDSSKYVLPETTWEITDDWTETPLMGIFNETFTLSVNGEDFTLNSVMVKLPIFVIVLMILFLTIIIGWIIILVKNRRDRKARRRV